MAYIVGSIIVAIPVVLLLLLGCKIGFWIARRRTKNEVLAKAEKLRKHLEGCKDVGREGYEVVMALLDEGSYGGDYIRVIGWRRGKKYHVCIWKSYLEKREDKLFGGSLWFLHDSWGGQHLELRWQAGWWATISCYPEEDEGYATCDFKITDRIPEALGILRDPDAPTNKLPFDNAPKP